MGNLPFQDKVFEMFKVGTQGYIQEVSSGQVLTVDSKSNNVTLKRKICKRTRSQAAAENIISDSQKWIQTGLVDSDGWFRIANPFSGKYLTSDSKKSVKLEDLNDPNDPKHKKGKKGKKDKKELVQVRKVFVWCPYVEEFVTYVAYCRGYEDQDLQIDMGMDAGKNKSILGLLLKNSEQSSTSLVSL